jgi:hypothetical protein
MLAFDDAALARLAIAATRIALAHGFTVAQLVDLVRAGLATATVRITEAGRRALAGR